MTQQEKARAYDQAIINGSRLWECGLITRESYEYIFPELKEKESEDDRIRKTLIHIVKGACGKYGIKYQGTEIGEERLLSWLEMHGEKKDSDVNGQIHDMTYNPIEKVEQKPEEWSKQQVVNAITSMLSERLKPLIKKSSDGTISHREEMFMDALVEMRSFVNSPSFQIGKDVSDEWSEEDEMAIDAIAQLMKDCERNNGWEKTYIDDGNVEVKFDYIASWLKSLKPQPKQEWSEEDEKMLADACIMLDWYKGNNWWKAQYIKNWLMSLKHQPKQELDEDTQQWVECIIKDYEDKLAEDPDHAATIQEKINILKSLRPQTQQKPANKVYTFKAIPRLLDLIQPSARAKSYCQKLIASLEQEGYSTDAKIVRGYLKRMNGETVAMATMDGQKHTGNVSEWSDEDEDIKYSIIDILTRQGFQTQVNWLKSLKPHWKPSEEQMCNLKAAYESYDFCDGERYALESLFNGLQKLL